jgi:hypothetical protein
LKGLTNQIRANKILCLPSQPKFDFDLSIGFQRICFKPELPDFSLLKYQNGGKYAKLPLNYQMAIKYTKWP